MPQPYKTALLVLSDKAYQGLRQDACMALLTELLPKKTFEIIKTAILPDEEAEIMHALLEFADLDQADLILTSGGTGLGPRDCTPEATLKVLDRSVPGIAEAMRARTAQMSPLAYLSRSVCGLRKSTFIVNLPGSPKAVKECMEVILPLLLHGLEILRGDVTEHPPLSAG